MADDEREISPWEKIPERELDENDFDAGIQEMADLQAAFETSNMSSPKFNYADYAALLYLYHKTADVPANIAEATDYDRTYIHQRLTRLEEWGVVNKRGHGVYELDRYAASVLNTLS